MEVLTVCVKKSTTTESFQLFHCQAKDPAVTHLIFADDIPMFCKGDLDSVNALMKGVHSFTEISGLRINTEKCACFFGNVYGATKSSLLAATGFNEGAF